MLFAVDVLLNFCVIRLRVSSNLLIFNPDMNRAVGLPDCIVRSTLLLLKQAVCAKLRERCESSRYLARDYSLSTS